MTTWVSRYPRLRAVYDRYRVDPYLRGKTSEAVGAALLADGLIGLDNPLAGRNKRPGILGALVMVAIGLLLLFVIVGLLSSNDPYPNGRTVAGTVSAVTPQHGSNGSSSGCTATVQYRAAGRQFSASSGFSAGSLCNDQGESVSVSFPVGHPAQGRPQFAEAGQVTLLIRVLGWVLLVVGILSSLLRLAEIVTGSRLLFRGRRLIRDSPPVPAGQLLEDLKDAWTGRQIRR